MLEAGRASSDEIESYQLKEVSKEIFGLSFTLLVKADEIDVDRVRYYAAPITIRGEQYLLCYQWFDKNKPLVIDWINKHEE